MSSIRMLFAIGATNGWAVHHIDVSTAFLHGDVDVDVYMTQPPGFIDGDRMVAHLHKCLYGLKQAPRAWFNKLAGCLKSLGLEPCAADSSLWVGKDTPYPFFLGTIVDDMAATSPDEAYTIDLLTRILKVFAGKHMGIISHYNGMRVVWLCNGRRCLLLQPAHIDKFVAMIGDLADMSINRNVPIKPHLKLCKTGTSEDMDSPLLDTTVYPYRALVGGLNYVACCTRPDITFTVNQLARYSNAPTAAHWNAAVDCLRYVKHTKWWGIALGGHGPEYARVHVKTVPEEPAPRLAANSPPVSQHAGLPPLPPGYKCVGYADANHGTGIDDRRSVSGTLIQVLGGPVSWSSTVQPTQSVSTVDSEIYAMSAASREALWIAKLADKFGVPARPFLVRADCHGAVCAATTYSYTKHAKHIAIHQDFMRDRYQQGDLMFQHIKGCDNPADIFTKALPYHPFAKHRLALGMMELPADLR
jgi:histone deacetylase 1/2